MDSEVTVLWSSFSASRDPDLRQVLIQRYGAIARTIAAKLYKGRPDDTVHFDDYLQYARVGLIESIDRFDGARGTPFEAYASYRIRGAVLNGLSRETELRARYSRREFRVTEREESLAGPMLLHPDSAELDDFIRLTVGLAVGFILEDGFTELSDPTPAANPYAQAELAQLRRRIRDLVTQLPARERQVLQAHYYEHREFQEVAHRMGISKGRVSQLHARALAQIRAWLNARPRIDRSL